MQEYQLFFEKYVNSFLSGNIEEDYSILLKKYHTLRVTDNCNYLADSLHLSKEESELAEIIGLFHDLGRFPQWHYHKTFSDNDSFNHGEKANEIIIENKILDSYYFKNTVLVAIENHNKPFIDKDLNDFDLFFSKLIRDADKMDILRMIADRANGKNQIKYGIKNTSFNFSEEFTPEAMQSIIEGKIVQSNTVNTITDRILLILGFAYDINFNDTLKVVLDENLLEDIFSLLPKTDIFIKLKDKYFKNVRDIVST